MTGLCDIDALVPIPVKTSPATLQELQKIAGTKAGVFAKKIKVSF